MHAARPPPGIHAETQATTTCVEPEEGRARIARLNPGRVKARPHPDLLLYARVTLLAETCERNGLRHRCGKQCRRELERALGAAASLAAARLGPPLLDAFLVRDAVLTVCTLAPRHAVLCPTEVACELSSAEYADALARAISRLHGELHVAHGALGPLRRAVLARADWEERRAARVLLRGARARPLDADGFWCDARGAVVAVETYERMQIASLAFDRLRVLHGTSQTINKEKMD